VNEARGLEQSCTSRCMAQVLATELAGLWRSFNKALFDPYRPERHYMRGCGPGWHAKHGQPACRLRFRGTAPTEIERSSCRCRAAPKSDDASDTSDTKATADNIVAKPRGMYFSDATPRSDFDTRRPP
jgi:hypothetical protein